MTGLIGSVVPVFSRTSAARIGQSCGTPVAAVSPAVAAGAAAGACPPLSMIAVSPDGKYVAGVAPGGKAVDVWVSGSATAARVP